jgi:ATP-dependent Lhr-like helicase
VAERFFDESGGMQLVLHVPFGGRINRALGLALRKRMCRGFGFELQAAANEDALVISLGEQHSFPLEDVFRMLHSKSARDLLVQALLVSPFFTTRWRWNASRALLLPRLRGGRPVPPPIQRMRAEDLLARCFPHAVACGETLPPGDIEIPMDHPIVRQTVEDALNEATDADGLVELLRGIESGSIEALAVERTEPSPFAHGILHAQPYAFLDDAPLEERRTQAVRTRRVLDARTADDLGALDPAALARVREEAWPQPESAEELHEALLWMGFLTAEEAAPWSAWLGELRSAGRLAERDGRIFAVEAPAAGPEVLAGRLEALGPLDAEDPLAREFEAEMLQLEAEGRVLRARFDGRPGWCNRRLLARIHRYTLERLRQAVQPRSAADFLRFLSRWQHVEPEARLHGPRGVLEVVRQLAGFQVPAAAWERQVLPARVEGYQPRWLDELALAGELAWGRLWGSGGGAVRSAPIALLPREDLAAWLALSPPPALDDLPGEARALHDALAARGAMFQVDLVRACGLLPSRARDALKTLVTLGLVTSDGYAGLRGLLTRPRHGRERARPDAGGLPSGRWELLRRPDPAAGALAGEQRFAPGAELAARALLRRTGVVFRRAALRERIPVAWRDLLQVWRVLEARGEIHGGRFVGGFPGEQFALPEAVALLRRAGQEPRPPLSVAACDPLNFAGILTPDAKVPANSRGRVAV